MRWWDVLYLTRGWPDPDPGFSTFQWVKRSHAVSNHFWMIAEIQQWYDL